MPAPVVELLRLCIVVFFAGLGYLVGASQRADQRALGPLDAATTGILLGAAVGYVFGGVMARLTGKTLDQAEQALRERSVEQVLAGLAGAVLGVLLTAGLLWPVLLIGSAAVTLPLFVFACVAVATLGHRIGMAHREDLMAVIAPRSGLITRAHVSSLPRLLDTSVAIDGRIVDVVRAGFLHGTLLVPEPVLDELRGLADAGDDTRRARGRRGLDALDALRRERGIDIEVIGDEAMEVPDVDAKLIRIAVARDIPLLTLDTNLARAAALTGCQVMNLHALSLALRPPVSAGDVVAVLLTRPGKEAGQAVGYLDDGTMVVVERSRPRVGEEVRATVTSVMTTANGRLVFARPDGPDRAV
jgi:uncharacterized protein YacL